MLPEIDKAKYRYILIGGCQRSGTRIASKILSERTGYEYVDEKDFNFYDLINFCSLLSDKPKVIHCPTMTSIFHFLKRDDILLVFVKRNIDDIRESQRKLNWEDSRELLNYDYPPDINLSKIGYWEKQKQSGINYLEINYEDLKDHDLWIDNRFGFAWDQTI